MRREHKTKTNATLAETARGRNENKPFGVVPAGRHRYCDDDADGKRMASSVCSSSYLAVAVAVVVVVVVVIVVVIIPYDDGRAKENNKIVISVVVRPFRTSPQRRVVLLHTPKTL